MKLIAKRDIKNEFDQTLWIEGKEYDCSLYSDVVPHTPNHHLKSLIDQKLDLSDEYLVTCELLGPPMINIFQQGKLISISQIKTNFYTLDEIRNSKLAIILE